MKTTPEQAAALYPPPSVTDALTHAHEWIDEWDYEYDPHGFCHERPTLIALVEAVERMREIFREDAE